MKNTFTLLCLAKVMGQIKLINMLRFDKELFCGARSNLRKSQRTSRKIVLLIYKCDNNFHSLNEHSNDVICPSHSQLETMEGGKNKYCELITSLVTSLESITEEF